MRQQGKRTRRAVIRLRHVRKAARFMGWLFKTCGLCCLPDQKPHRVYATFWHQWHALGCP